MATPGVKFTLNIPAELYEWLETQVSRGQRSQFIVALLEKAREEAAK